MTNLHLIVLGTLKEKYWQEAEREYLKRLSPVFKITIHELKEESFGEKDMPEHITQKEAVKISKELEKIKPETVLALDEHGTSFSSVKWAEYLGQVCEEAHTIALIIGGPFGLHPSIREKVHKLISLSPLTFTHQMARIILLEQIYRAMMIQSGRKYHY